MAPKIHKFKLSNYQPNPAHPRYVVDCTLRDMRTTPDVYWSESYNSYVLAEVSEGNTWANHPFGERYYWRRGEQLFQLVSINGAGEMRWDVPKERLDGEIKYEQDCLREGREMHGDGREFLAAARHFGLIPRRSMTNNEATVWGDSQERP
jgi:hypothetical protein